MFESYMLFFLTRKVVSHQKESLRQSTVQANEGGGKVKRRKTYLSDDR